MTISTSHIFLLQYFNEASAHGSYLFIYLFSTDSDKDTHIQCKLIKTTQCQSRIERLREEH